MWVADRSPQPSRPCAAAGCLPHDLWSCSSIDLHQLIEHRLVQGVHRRDPGLSWRRLSGFVLLDERLQRFLHHLLRQGGRCGGCRISGLMSGVAPQPDVTSAMSVAWSAIRSRSVTTFRLVPTARRSRASGCRRAITCRQRISMAISIRSISSSLSMTCCARARSCWASERTGFLHHLAHQLAHAQDIPVDIPDLRLQRAAHAIYLPFPTARLSPVAPAPLRGRISSMMCSSTCTWVHLPAGRSASGRATGRCFFVCMSLASSLVVVQRLHELKKETPERTGVAAFALVPARTCLRLLPSLPLCGLAAPGLHLIICG